MEYPVYYSNNNSFTCILSLRKFVQVKRLNMIMILTAGENQFEVDDTIKYDVLCTEKEFTAAYRTAMEHAACFVNEAHNLTMQKNNSNGTNSQPG